MTTEENAAAIIEELQLRANGLSRALKEDAARHDAALASVREACDSQVANLEAALRAAREATITAEKRATEAFAIIQHQDALILDLRAQIEALENRIRAI